MKQQILEAAAEQAAEHQIFEAAVGEEAEVERPPPPKKEAAVVEEGRVEETGWLGFWVYIYRTPPRFTPLVETGGELGAPARARCRPITGPPRTDGTNV